MIAGVLLLLLFVGGALCQVGAGGRPLLALHAATVPFALAGGVAGLARLVRGAAGPVPREAWLRTAVAASAGAFVAYAAVTLGAPEVAVGAVVVASAGAAVVRAARGVEAAGLDADRLVLAAYGAQVIGRLAMRAVGSWDPDATLFALGLMVAPPVLVLGGARVAGRADGATLALAALVAYGALFLALGGLWVGAASDGPFSRALRPLLAEGRLTTWAPVLVAVVIAGLGWRIHGRPVPARAGDFPLDAPRRSEYKTGGNAG